MSDYYDENGKIVTLRKKRSAETGTDTNGRLDMTTMVGGNLGCPGKPTSQKLLSLRSFLWTFRGPEPPKKNSGL